MSQVKKKKRMNTPFRHNDVQVRRVAGRYVHATRPGSPTKEIKNLENYKGDTYIVEGVNGDMEFLEGRAKPGAVIGAVATGLATAAVIATMAFGGGKEAPPPQQGYIPPTISHEQQYTSPTQEPGDFIIQEPEQVLPHEDITFNNAYVDYGIVTTDGERGICWGVQDEGGKWHEFFKSEVTGLHYKADSTGNYVHPYAVEHIFLEAEKEVAKGAGNIHPDDLANAARARGGNTTVQSGNGNTNVEGGNQQGYGQYETIFNSYVTEQGNEVLWGFTSDSAGNNWHSFKLINGVHYKDDGNGNFHEAVSGASIANAYQKARQENGLSHDNRQPAGNQPQSNNVEVRNHPVLKVEDPYITDHIMDGQAGVLWGFQVNGEWHNFFRNKATGLHHKDKGDGSFTDHAYDVEGMFQQAVILMGDTIIQNMSTGSLDRALNMGAQNLAHNMQDGGTAKVKTLNVTYSANALASMTPKADPNEYNRETRRALEHGDLTEINGHLIKKDGSELV